MPAFALTLLKFGFLALLYLFVWRAVRWVVVDMRPPKPAKVRTGGVGAPAVAVKTAAPAPPRRRGRQPARLVVLNERGKRGVSLALTGTIQIGRAEACHLRLPDSYASQFHAKVFADDGTWFVDDLGSTNGTFLNDRKVGGPLPLSVGDRLRVGKTVIEVQA